jgi:hypothetical protein
MNKKAVRRFGVQRERERPVGGAMTGSRCIHLLATDFPTKRGGDLGKRRDHAASRCSGWLLEPIALSSGWRVYRLSSNGGFSWWRPRIDVQD